MRIHIYIHISLHIFITLDSSPIPFTHMFPPVVFTLRTNWGGVCIFLSTSLLSDTASLAQEKYSTEVRCRREHKHGNAFPAVSESNEETR